MIGQRGWNVERSLHLVQSLSFCQQQRPIQGSKWPWSSQFIYSNVPMFQTANKWIHFDRLVDRFCVTSMSLIQIYYKLFVNHCKMIGFIQMHIDMYQHKIYQFLAKLFYPQARYSVSSGGLNRNMGGIKQKKECSMVGMDLVGCFHIVCLTHSSYISGNVVTCSKINNPLKCIYMPRLKALQVNVDQQIHSSKEFGMFRWNKKWSKK